MKVLLNQTSEIQLGATKESVLAFICFQKVCQYI